MKKIISVFLCLSLLFAMCMSLSSCFEEKKETPDPKVKDYENALTLLANCDYTGAKAAFEKLGDYKDAKEYLSKFYYMPVRFDYDLTEKKGTNYVAYNGMNLPIRETTMRPDAQSICNFEYDDKGNITKQIMIVNTESAPEVSTYEYTYDSKGYLMTGHYVGHDGYSATYTFKYDEKGNMVEQIYVDESSTYEYFMAYDENGNMIRQETVFGDMNQVLDISYTFDEEGRTTKEVCTYPDGSQESVDYTYDQNGNRIKYLFTESDGDQSFYDYTYDANGNVIKEVFTDDDGSVQVVETEYKLLYIPCGITEGTDYFFRGLWGDRL
jgi:YD repeat-containing protein